MLWHDQRAMMQQQFEMAVAVEIFVGLEEFEEFGSYCTTVVQDKIEGALKTESFQVCRDRWVG